MYFKTTFITHQGVFTKKVIHVTLRDCEQLE